MAVGYTVSTTVSLQSVDIAELERCCWWKMLYMNFAMVYLSLIRTLLGGYENVLDQSFNRWVEYHVDSYLAVFDPFLLGSFALFNKILLAGNLFQLDPGFR